MRFIAHIAQAIAVLVFALSAGSAVSQAKQVSYAPLPRGAEVAPSAVLERMTVDGEPVSLDDPIEIPAGARKIHFEFGAVANLNQDRLQYRYRLEGVDEAWVLAGTRSEAYYTYLDPGSYTFRVEVSDIDEDWLGEPTDFPFSISPFFYETPLFQLLCLIALAVIILGAYRWRVQHLRAREDELLELIEMHTKHLRDEKERTEGALAETERARREAERQKEIAQRSRAVIERQAEQLREVDRIKTRFFSNVSHEFRTPLTLTIGPLENMLAGVYGPLHDQARKQLDLALRNARRLLRLINQLLDLSKLEAGKMDLTITRGNVVPLVEGVVMSFTAYTEKKNVHLTFSCERDDMTLCFDPTVLEKVLFNLLSNAVKFTEDGDSIRVSLDEGPMQIAGQNHDAVLIHVNDSGIGIPDEQLPYIFDRFHQVDGAIAHAHEGTGIGLSLVKELVELHHGTITVRSEEGAGSEFVVALPKGMTHFGEDVLVGDPSAHGMRNVSRGPMMEMAVLSDDDGPWAVSLGDRDATRGQRRPIHGDGGRFLIPHSEAMTGGSPPEAPDWRSRPSDPGHEGQASLEVHTKATILVVDDNPEVVDYISSALDAEYDVISATNGRDAFEMASRHDPNLIISDVMMPGMDGYALCRRLKGDTLLQHIPVILLTAKAAQSDKIEGLEAGSDDYISKPFSTRELKARIRNLLTVREQQQQLSNLNAELSEMNDALREASEMKSQLLSIAAHDMKNPLSAIREFARILKSEIGEESNHYDPLDLIHQSSDEMLHLVSTLLDSAALETGQIMLKKEPLDVNTLASTIVRRNQKLAERKNQIIELYTSAQQVVVRADKNRLLEAMDNLVNNAVKYSPHNRSIRVAVERTASNVRFSVEDEGPGLTDDDKTKLFRKFQRLSAQPTGGEVSTGLGLAIVKQIVELHDGSVTLESDRGRGSIFTIDLPGLSELEA